MSTWPRGHVAEIITTNNISLSSRGGLVRLFVAQIQVERGRRTVDRIPLGTKIRFYAVTLNKKETA